MKNCLKSILCTALLYSIAISPSMAQETSDKKPVANQTAQSLEVTGADDSKRKIHYWLFLPADYQAKPDDSKKWPLMIFLHGMGERGPVDGSKLDRVKIWGPPKRVADQSDFPFVLVSPQCPDTGRGWNTEHLIQLVDAAIKEHNVDPTRVYLTGLSMGGYGTWSLAAKYPDRFAAAIPICGGGNPQTAEKLKDMPIWAFHGDADRVVTIKQTQKMVDAIKEVGGEKVELTVYEGVGHNSWSKTYANPKIYEWLLKHKRQ